MDSDVGKLFIGGVSWETTEDRLQEHFSTYGEVTHAVIMRDKVSGRPRGFGFVVFADPQVLDRVLLDPHTIDGRTVEAKRALSREEQHPSHRSSNVNAAKSFGTGVGGNMRTKKIFVGGLPPTLNEDGFRQYFQQFGNVVDVVIMYDQNTQRPRGFGFISFDSEDAIDHVLHKSFHDLNGKLVEVKRALPKDANPNNGSYCSSGGGSFQLHGRLGGNPSAYGKMDSSRYMAPQGTGGSFQGFASSGYGPPNFDYGAPGNGVAYGTFGTGGYGSAASGYDGPTGSYGNPNAPVGGYAGGASAGYLGGAPGVTRGPWNNEAYAAPSSWDASVNSGNAINVVLPSGAVSYGHQGYGYCSYSSVEGAAYAAGGRGIGVPVSNPSGGSAEHGVGPGYVGVGYGDTNGKSGYAGPWRTDSQGSVYGTAKANGPGGSGSFGGFYVGGAGRQTQQ